MSQNTNNDSDYDSEYYDISEDDYYKHYYSEQEPECEDCGLIYVVLTNGKCNRCYRSAFTLLEMKTPLPLTLGNIIFSMLGVEIDHKKRRLEYKSKKLCWRFRKTGKCKFGTLCRFTHLVKNPKLCWYFLQGECYYGENCRYIHKSWKVCQQFIKGRKCHFGKNCYYIHTNRKVCRYFFQGKCHFDKKCLNYHLVLS